MSLIQTIFMDVQQIDFGRVFWLGLLLVCIGVIAGLVTDWRKVETLTPDEPDAFK